MQPDPTEMFLKSLRQNQLPQRSQELKLQDEENEPTGSEKPMTKKSASKKGQSTNPE